MLSIAAFIMGICPPARLTWLKETTDHLDSQNFPFQEKLMAIDQFDNHFLPEEDLHYYRSKGWRIFLESCRSRKWCTEIVLKNLHTDIVFYNEDDVKATLPSMEDIEKVFNTTIDGRKCGIISMTLGGCQFDAPSSNIGDLKFMEENAIVNNDRYLIFRRLEEYRNPWFFEFPGLFIRSDLFRECHEKAKEIAPGYQIEMALTHAWFSLNLHQEYYKASVAVQGALNTLLTTPAKVNSLCRLLSDMDINQGSSPLGGCHTY